MEHDKLDSMSEMELRVFARHALAVIREIKYGSNDDGEYGYYWVRAKCDVGLELVCPHCHDMDEHTHKFDNGDIYYHPIRTT